MSVSAAEQSSCSNVTVIRLHERNARHQIGLGDRRNSGPPSVSGHRRSTPLFPSCQHCPTTPAPTASSRADGILRHRGLARKHACHVLPPRRAATGRGQHAPGAECGASTASTVATVAQPGGPTILPWRAEAVSIPPDPIAARRTANPLEAVLRRIQSPAPTPRLTRPWWLTTASRWRPLWTTLLTSSPHLPTISRRSARSRSVGLRQLFQRPRTAHHRELRFSLTRRSTTAAASCASFPCSSHRRAPRLSTRRGSITAHWPMPPRWPTWSRCAPRGARDSSRRPSVARWTRSWPR
jgi:hypothetical protein